MNNNDCLFCKIARGEIASQKVFENDVVYAFKDINPQAPVHILVIPKKHIACIADADHQDALLIGQLILTANTLARECGLHDNGYRLVINNGESAGQAVFHVHVHVLGGRTFAWPPG